MQPHKTTRPWVEPIQSFFRDLLDVLFPDPQKKNCPHCGGGKCLSLCGILGERADGQATQDKGKGEGQEAGPAGGIDPCLCDGA